MKGQGITLKDMPTAVIVFAVAVIVVAMMTTVIDSMQTSVATFANTVNINESLGSVINGSTYMLDGTGSKPKNFAVIVVVNATNVTVLPSTSYTFTDMGIGYANFMLKNNTWNNSVLKVTYSNDYATPDAAFNISNQGITGYSTIATFFSPIAVIIAAVIIIGLILGAFAISGRRSSSSAGV